MASESIDSLRAAEHQRMMGELMPECKECRTAKWVVEDEVEGKVVCRNCGDVVTRELISDGSEWRTFSDGGSASKSDPHRVGGPENELLQDMGLSTIIGEGAKNLATCHNRGVMSAAQRSLLVAFEKIEAFGEKLCVGSHVVGSCKELYKRVEDSKQLKGRKGDAVVLAALLIACRQAGCPRTLNEVCAAGEVPSKDVGRCFLRIKELKLHKKVGEKKIAASAAREKLIKRYCGELKMGGASREAAISIGAMAAKMGLLGARTDATLAGAAIYMAWLLGPLTPPGPGPGGPGSVGGNGNTFNTGGQTMTSSSSSSSSSSSNGNSSNTTNNNNNNNNNNGNGVTNNNGNNNNNTNSGPANNPSSSSTTTTTTSSSSSWSQRPASLSLREIADVVALTASTIRQAYKVLWEQRLDVVRAEIAPRDLVYALPQEPRD